MNDDVSTVLFHKYDCIFLYRTIQQQQTNFIYFNHDNTYSIKYLVEIHNSINEQTTTHERDETGIFSYTYPGNHGIITLYPEEGESWQIGYSLDMVRCLIFSFESGMVISFFKDCYDSIFVEKEGSF